MARPCEHCGGDLLPESLSGIIVYRTTDDDRHRIYRAQCAACKVVTEIVSRGAVDWARRPFSTGRRWLCVTPGRARFYFVILGPGTNTVGKPDPRYVRCRLEVLPYDLDTRLPGYKQNGMESSFSKKHVEKHAYLEEP